MGFWRNLVFIYFFTSFFLMLYKIMITDEFDHDFQKLDHSLQIQISKEISQLEQNPYAGKPLGFTFFREKKIHNYRVYYLVYDDYVLVFVIALSTKKDQQKVINKIKHLLPYYKEEVKKKFSV